MVTLFVFKKPKQLKKPLTEIQSEKLEPEVKQSMEPDPEPEPEWTIWVKVREENNPKFGKVLNDIESHMPLHHIYRDSNLITSSHETTHGINSNIRQKHQGVVRINAFYCLNDRACIIREPNITISAIAPKIPQHLRGPSYQLYLINQTRDWNDDPLYLFDEWSAYTNGALTGEELRYGHREFELLQAHNFNVYCVYLAKVVEERCPDYNNVQLKSFLMWNIQRVCNISIDTEIVRVLAPEIKEVESHIDKGLYPYLSSWQGSFSVAEYLDKVRTGSDSEEFRVFCRQYFGSDWCLRVYGF